MFNGLIYGLNTINKGMLIKSKVESQKSKVEREEGRMNRRDAEGAKNTPSTQ
jgi:hypothetical protein